MPEDDDQPRSPRGFWSGNISFGLVSVPVSLFVATRSSRVALRMVDESGTPLSRVYLCSDDERRLSRDEIVRGYEVEKDRFVVVEDEELEAIAPEKSRDIALERLVDVAAIDPVYFERAYFLAPDRGGLRPYRLLAQVMEDRGRAGIATFVMRGKEYLVAIIAERGLLRAETLRFHDELRTPADVGLPALEEVGEEVDGHRVREMTKALQTLQADRLERKALADRRMARLEALVKRKLKSGSDVLRAAPQAEPSARESAEVIDLMQVLRRRLKGRAAEKKRAGRSHGGNRETKKEAAQAPRSAARRDDLEGSSKSDLYARAKRLAIPGRSSMSKEELIEAIRDAG